MTAVSGRVGLFTIGNFNPNLTDDVHATTRAQKSGAMRLEFGKITVPTAATTVASVKMTVNTGIMAVVTPGKVPSPAANASGQLWAFAASSFLSGVLHISMATGGGCSGLHSGMDINYLIVGY